jgi:quercetin dioxygenase-like cupin family protein
VETAREASGYTEPVGDEFGGFRSFVRPKAPYDLFMEHEGVPVYRPIGIHDVRGLELAAWPRTGGRGAFIQLHGTEEQWGMYLLEIPPRATLNPERHIYEEFFYVIEGEGLVELERPGAASREAAWHSAAWHRGSLFAIPRNVRHRLTSTSTGRTLLIGATLAPQAINLFQDGDFVFSNPYEFSDSVDDRYHEYRSEVLADPARGRAYLRTNFVPDVVHLEMPRDNQRSPGYRRVEPHMASDSFYSFVGEHQVGRYSRAHYHQPGAVLVCVSGRGYTYAWRRSLGTTPWQTGHGDEVLRQDYVPGGMVSAAPGGSDFFHQHFGASKEPLRMLALLGLWRWRHIGGERARPGEKATSGNLTIEEGGNSIAYENEDPHIRGEYQALMREYGIEPVAAGR